MKTSARLSAISAAIGLGLLAASGTSWAESQYGYDPTGAGVRTATARLNITVAVPKLILLRVGTSGTAVDTIALGANFTNGIPGGLATLADGSNQATGWDGTAPTLTTTSSGTVQAWAWTNSGGGGSVSSAVTTPFPAGSGITASDITVTSTPVGTTGLNHPGANTGTSTPTTFPRNVVATSNWTFAATPAVLAGVAGGATTQVVTYTATTL